MAEILTDLSKAIIEGAHTEAKRLTEEALAGGTPPGEVLNGGLLPGMEEVGRLFREEEYYIPEVMLSARAMRFGMEVLDPLLAASGVEPKGRVVLGTVKGDLHDIGKDLVGMMLSGGGYRVIDLGKDVGPEAFVEAVRKDGAQVIGLSALLTTTMENMADTIRALEEAGLRDQVKVIVGGAPVTDEYAKQIGADGYGKDAVAAVEQVKVLIGA